MEKEHKKIINLDSFKVLGITIETTPKNGQDMKDIGSLWEKFNKQNLIDKIPNKENKEILAIYHNYKSDHLEPYSYTIGAKVSLVNEVPKGMELINIPPLQYTEYTAEGEFPNCLIETWKKIWNDNILRAFSYDFEVYDEKFMNTNSKHKKLNIFISSHTKESFEEFHSYN
ncbi:MAG: GyrI-like domain-containing protein [Bacteroidetes bacterium]|nr:GyrI-like domain-containing protein [Bacteroidota bacterium]